jgi:acyl-CoA thioesterase FadM
MGRSRWSTEVAYSGLTPEGTVRLNRVAEWFQEAAVHASLTGGYPPSRYEEMGASWFVSELEVAVDRPIGYGEKIEVETWISDLRRFRTHREYRVFDARGEIVARGRADWLFLQQDPVTRKIRPRLPDEPLKAAFPIIADRAMTDELDLELPSSAPKLEVVRTVRPTELDRHEHVNHTAYVAWLEDLELRARRVHIRFEKDARPGDEIALRVWSDGSRGIVEARRADVRILVAATKTV